MCWHINKDILIVMTTWLVRDRWHCWLFPLWVWSCFAELTYIDNKQLTRKHKLICEQGNLCWRRLLLLFEAMMNILPAVSLPPHRYLSTFWKSFFNFSRIQIFDFSSIPEPIQNSGARSWFGGEKNGSAIMMEKVIFMNYYCNEM